MEGETGSVVQRSGWALGGADGLLMFKGFTVVYMVHLYQQYLRQRLRNS